MRTCASSSLSRVIALLDTARASDQASGEGENAGKAARGDLDGEAGDGKNDEDNDDDDEEVREVEVG